MAALLLTAPLAAQEEGADEATPAAPEITGLETFEVDSAAHTEDDVDYPQDPPAGGPHNPVWQSCGFYEAPVRPEHAVHSQEHGAVWITFRPGLPERELTLLERLVERNEYVLVSPYPEQAEPVIVSPGASSSGSRRQPTSACAPSSGLTPATAPSAAPPATAAPMRRWPCRPPAPSPRRSLRPWPPRAPEPGSGERSWCRSA
jgi:hypothetical protein